MKADLSRNSFDSGDNFRRVLLQQGRVLLDSDWNEQVSILLDQMRVLAAGIAGPYAGPKNEPGYEVVGALDGLNFSALNDQRSPAQRTDFSGKKDFLIGPGPYFVDGILVQNDQIHDYTNQPFFKPVGELETGAYLVFLDIWERHVTPIEVDGIADAALRGIETAHRSQIVWQVRVQPFKEKPFTAQRNGNVLAGLTVTPENGTAVSLDVTGDPEVPDVTAFFNAFLKEKAILKEMPLEPENSGTLVVSLNRPKSSNGDNVDAATAPNEAQTFPRYRGTEHRLYRVEIHQGGEVKSGEPTNVTFKWSRENGSIVFPVENDVQGNIVTVRAIPGDTSRRPREDGYVELLDESHVLTHHHNSNHAKPRQLFKVGKVEPTGEYYRVTLKHTDGSNADALPGKNHNLLRVWDHEAGDGVSLIEGAIPVPDLQSNDSPLSLALEDGLYVRFPGGAYRMGDYWLISARAGISPQPWEDIGGDSEPLPVRSVEHHFAPLAAIDVEEGGVNRRQDLRMTFESEIKVIP